MTITKNQVLIRYARFVIKTGNKPTTITLNSYTFVFLRYVSAFTDLDLLRNEYLGMRVIVNDETDGNGIARYNNGAFELQ